MESVLNNGIKSIKGPSIFGFIKRMNEHPVFHLYEIMKEYDNEDLIKCSSLFYLVNSPELARLILNKDQKDFSQEDFVGKRTKTVFGKGLVTSQGELWASQRKILNPVFNIDGVHPFIEDAIVEIDNVIAQWVKFSEKQKTFDLVDEMANLAIMVAGKVLFNTDFKDDIQKIKKAVKNGTKYIVNGLPFFIPYWVPTVSHLKLRSINRKIDNILNPIITDRLNYLNNRNDLSGALIAMLKKNNSSKEKRRLVLDEMKTMLSGGYFPVACCLSMFWHSLGEDPKFIHKLNEEIKKIPKDYKFTAHFYSDFPVTTSIIFETMRKYPIAFSIWRKSKVEQNIDGYIIPKGKTVCISIFNIHRNPKYWENPNIFDPERFNEKNSKERPKHHFMPFGWGNRKCIGDNYGMMIVFLGVIRIIQKFNIEIIANQKLIIKNAPLISPKHVYAKVTLKEC